VTFNVTLFPASRVKGNEAPLIENPLPVVRAAVRVNFPEPSFVSTTGTVELVPIGTWSNDTVEGLALKDSLSTPSPPTSSTRVGFEALLENVTVPLVCPSAVGLKLTFTSTLCPAGRTSGRSRLEVNLELLTAIFETVTLFCPVLVTVTNKVSV
jgi:hypothetical protein